MSHPKTEEHGVFWAKSPVSPEFGKRMKLVPEQILTREVEGDRLRVLPVSRVVVYQPGAHPEDGCPIRGDWAAVRVETEGGRPRWFGSEHARITSGLRVEMLVDDRDEVLAKWEDGGGE